MEYEQFIMKVKDKVEESVGCDYNVMIHHVIKNNSLELDGITICSKDSKVSPNIYLNDYYEKYKYGETVDSIASEILKLYEDNNENSNFEISFGFREMKSNIIFRIINYSKNKKLLLDIPHIRFVDLAITFHCLIKNDSDGIGTIRITNEYMNQWGTSINELMKYAGSNTQRVFPANIRPMNEVIESIFRRDIEKYIGDINTGQWEDFTGEDFDSLSEDVIDLIQGLDDKPLIPMYILSNSNGINGASTILYKDILKEFAVKHNSDFYILPSSIHEVILVPYSEKISKESLKDMVQGVNQTQVPAEEVLSNQVYIYHKDTNAIEI